jgi:hypothetical protein
MYGVQFRGTCSQTNPSGGSLTIWRQQQRVLDGASDHRPGGFAACRF